jgi:hypothetical protein
MSLVGRRRFLLWTTCAVTRERRQACARNLRLVLEDAKRETAQPADVEAVLEDGAAALGALGADHPRTADG